MELKEIESAIEGVLFAAGEPVGVERLCLALDIDRITADSVCQRLADAYRYERRGIRLVRLDNSYQLCSAPEFADCIRRAFESRQTPAQSRACHTGLCGPDPRRGQLLHRQPASGA